MNIAPYLQTQKIRQWFFARYHADGAKCPNCGALLQNGTVAARNFWQMRRFICPNCRQRISARTGTPIAETHVGLEEFFLIDVLRTAGLPPGEIAKLTGKSETSVATVYERLTAWHLLIEGRHDV